jgi:cytochrome c553
VFIPIRVRKHNVVKRMSLSALLLFAIAIGVPAAADERADVFRSPLSNYMLTCQGCHSPNGVALRDQVPAFRGEVSRFLSIEGGREYLIQVPGVSKSPLSDQATADLMNWLLFFFDAAHVPDDFTPYTVEEVTRLRKKSLTNATQIREYLLYTSSSAAEN